VIVPSLVESVACTLQISEAEIGRRLGADRARLYQWKTYRRRMPTKALYKLATMAGVNLPNAVGQYNIEWTAKAQKGHRTLLGR
jgi:hypothetical protein